MGIKLEKLSKKEDTRAAGYLWTSENDPTWLRYRVDFDTLTMSGVHMSRCNGSVPNATPFIYNFRDRAETEAHFETVAMAIFADIGKETLVPEGGQPITNDAAEQVQDWQSFMSAFGGKKDKKSTGPAIEERSITYPSDQVVPYGIVKQAKGALSMPRGQNFRVGARMSGFDAVRLARAPGLPKKLKVGAMGDPDLDQASDALNSVDRPSSQAVTWYGIRDKTKANIRMQAAKSMPILAGLIADRHSLATAVDEMKPIQPVIMEMTGLGKAGVKRIGKLTQAAPAGKLFEAGDRIEGEDALGVNRARHTRISGSVPIDMALRYLSELPPDRAPQDDESWLKFNDVLVAVAIPLHNATSIPVSRILEASKGDWIKFHESLAKASDFDPDKFDRRTMALVTIDALEAVEHFNRSAVLPQALASIRDAEQPEPMVSREFVLSGADAARNLVIGNSKNVSLQMMEMSRRYASRIPAMMEIEGRVFAQVEHTSDRFAVYGNTSYPVLTDDFQASNGLVVRPLRNFDQLTEESRRLRHCVSGYTSSCRSTRCHLYSVQNAAGTESYSTIEFDGVEHSERAASLNDMRVRQHRSLRNGTPSEECKAAIAEFRDGLAKGGIPINVDEIAAWREYLTKNGMDSARVVTPKTTWKSVLELDWEDDDVRSAYWDEWGQVLGGKIAKANNPGVIYTEKSAQELVSAMSPRTAAIMIEEARRAREEREAEKAAAKNAEEEAGMEP